MRVCASCGATYADDLDTCPACGIWSLDDTPIQDAAGAAPARSPDPVPALAGGSDAPPPPMLGRPVAPWRWGCVGLLGVALVLFVTATLLRVLSPSSQVLPLQWPSPPAMATTLATWTAVQALPAGQTPAAPTLTTLTPTATPKSGHGGGAGPTPTLTPRPKPTATPTRKPTPTPTPVTTPGGGGG
jgi:hypothetical protein